MGKKQFSNPVTSELHDSGWFRRPGTDAEAARHAGSESDVAQHPPDPPTGSDNAPHASAAAKETDRPYARTDERTDGRTEALSSAASRTPARRTKRHSFEIYADQLERLKQLKAAAMLADEKLTMSDIVRQALDEKLAQLGRSGQ